MAAKTIANEVVKTGDWIQEYRARFKDLFRQMSVGGVSVKTITFTFYEGKLGRVSTKPPADRWDHLSRAFIDRYGKPTNDKTTIVKTRAGVTHKNRELAWKRPGGHIWLERYSNTIDETSVVYMSDTALTHLEQETKRIRKKAAEDL